MSPPAVPSADGLISQPQRGCIPQPRVARFALPRVSDALVSQSQRDCIIQPRVARFALPWVSRTKISQPQRGCIHPRFTKGAFAAIFLLVVCCFGSIAFAAETNTAPSAKVKKAHDPKVFEKEIKAFEAMDQTNPPPKDVTVFVGSSSIRKWTSLAQDFPDVPVINRGFGGSHLIDSVYYADRIVLPYHPKRIVLFAGSNDISFGDMPEKVARDFKAFVKKIHKAQPEVPIAYISISTSPSRFTQLEKVRKANQLISKIIAKDKTLTFINVIDSMIGEDGKPKPDIFGPDKLHMNPKGYAIWTEIVKPYLK